MPTPSSGDLDHFPIHDLSVIVTSVEEGNSQVPVTHQDPPDEEDGQVFLREDSERSPSTLKTKLGQAVLKSSRGIRWTETAWWTPPQVETKEKGFDAKAYFKLGSPHQHLLSADQSAVLLKRIELSCLVREREREHFSTHHELPIDDDYNKLVKLLGYYVKMLLRKWNILL